MSNKPLQPVRGTHDLLPEVQAQHNIVLDTARSISERFGFSEISTPIFEASHVFKRTLGEASDIVNKEMYTFSDRNGDEITLRPEGTAGIARCFISEGLSQRTPLKLFYRGPMFRYERPQKGRQRQFTQFGAEVLGSPSPLADLECISLADEVLKALKVRDLSVLEINSIGDSESRKRYTDELVKFLTQHQARLSADSQKRLTLNPLRILDSKDPQDHEILKNAPVISDFYNEASKSMFDSVAGLLRDLGIEFKINPQLVRGLDYYTHCVFEFKTTHLGAQDAILSGGRYDQLVEVMGGPATPAVGWGAGVERLVMLTPLKASTSRPVAVIPVHASVEAQAYKLCHDLRLNGLTAEIGFSGNLSKRMKRAAAQNSWAALVVGPDELARGEATLKLMDSGEQKNIKLNEAAATLRTLVLNVK